MGWSNSRALSGWSYLALLGLSHFLGSLISPFGLVDLMEATHLWAVVLAQTLAPSVKTRPSLKTYYADLDSKKSPIMRHRNRRPVGVPISFEAETTLWVGWSGGGQTAVRLSQQFNCSLSLDLQPWLGTRIQDSNNKGIYYKTDSMYTLLRTDKKAGF